MVFSIFVLQYASSSPLLSSSIKKTELTESDLEGGYAATRARAAAKNFLTLYIHMRTISPKVFGSYIHTLKSKTVGDQFERELWKKRNGGRMWIVEDVCWARMDRILPAFHKGGMNENDWLGVDWNQPGNEWDKAVDLWFRDFKTGYHLEGTYDKTGFQER